MKKMERTYIKDVTPGYRRVQGFVENFRNKRTMAFIVVKDITGKLQITVEKEKHPEMLEMLDSLTIHSVVTFEGEVVASEYVKMGGKEMYPDTMKIESLAEALPIKDDSDIDVKMDFRWIDLRRDVNHLMPHPEAHRRSQRVGLRRFRGQVLRRQGLPCSVPSVLQADGHGRRPRAHL